MRVEVLLQTDVDGLRVLAADRGGAGDMVGPLGIDDDIAVAKTHFGMDKPAIGVAYQHARLEAEGGL